MPFRLPLAQWFKTPPKLSLYWILSVPFALQTAIAVGLVGFLSLKQGEKVVDRLAITLIEEASDRIRENLDLYLNLPQFLQQIYRSNLRSGLLKPTDLAALEQSFWYQLQESSAIESLAFANEKGEYLSIARQSNPTHTTGNERTFLTTLRSEQTSRQLHSYLALQPGDRSELLDLPEFDRQDLPWYEAAKQAKTSTWSEPIPAREQPHLTLRATLPIYNETGFYGAIAAEISLHPLNERLRQLNLGKTGKSYIIDRQGRVIATSTPQLPITFTPEGTQQLNVKNSRDRVLQDMGQQILPHWDEIDEPERLTLTLAGEKQYLQIVPFREESGLQWSIAIIVPHREFRAAMQASRRNTLLISIVAIGTAALLGLTIALWIRRSLSPLKDNQ
jgi:hypothetical protein